MKQDFEDKLDKIGSLHEHAGDKGMSGGKGGHGGGSHGTGGAHAGGGHGKK